MYKILYCGEFVETCDTEDEAYDRIQEIICENYEHHPTAECEYSVVEE